MRTAPLAALAPVIRAMAQGLSCDNLKLFAASREAGRRAFREGQVRECPPHLDKLGWLTGYVDEAASGGKQRKERT